MTGQLAAGVVFAGVYRIERLLASGGMGLVYIAVHGPTGRRRALKVMSPTLMGSAIAYERFVLEARVGAQIPSEHVIDVMDAGVDVPTGSPWLAMELLDGETLAERVERAGALDHDAAIEVLVQMGHALGAAHARGIVHRDIKPENVFIATSQRRGVPFTVKILDFGIAKLIEEGKRSGTMTEPIGTPMWLAPEQAEQRGEVRPATDVWALGLVAFFAFTGKPFWRSVQDGRARMAPLLAEVMIEPIPSASARARELGKANTLPDGFDSWLARCLAREPAARWPDAGEAIAALAPAETEMLLATAVVQDDQAPPPAAPKPRAKDARRRVARTAPMEPDASGTTSPLRARGPWPRILGTLAAGLGATLFGAGFHACLTSAPPPPPPAPPGLVLVATTPTDAGTDAASAAAPHVSAGFAWDPDTTHEWVGIVSYPTRYTYRWSMTLDRRQAAVHGTLVSWTVLQEDGHLPATLERRELGIFGVYQDGHLSLETAEANPASIEADLQADGALVGRVRGTGWIAGWLHEGE